MEVDHRIALAIECALTAAACELAARNSTDPEGWQAIAGHERREGAALVGGYAAGLDVASVQAALRE